MMQFQIQSRQLHSNGIHLLTTDAQKNYMDAKCNIKHPT